LNVIDRAQGVRGGADGQQSRVAIDRAREIVPIELARFGKHSHCANRHAALFRQRLPRRVIRVVVEFGDDDLVAGVVSAPQRPRDMESDRGHIGAERDFIRLAIKEIGNGLPRVGDQLICLGAGWIGPVHVGVVMEEIIIHRFGDRARNLCAPGAVEIGHGEAVVHAFEGGKM
jgi:hypothetical protein